VLEPRRARKTPFFCAPRRRQRNPVEEGCSADPQVVSDGPPGDAFRICPQTRAVPFSAPARLGEAAKRRLRPG